VSSHSPYLWTAASRQVSIGDARNSGANGGRAKSATGRVLFGPPFVPAPIRPRPRNCTASTVYHLHSARVGSHGCFSGQSANPCAALFGGYQLPHRNYNHARRTIPRRQRPQRRIPTARHRHARRLAADGPARVLVGRDRGAVELLAPSRLWSPRRRHPLRRRAGRVRCRDAAVYERVRGELQPGQDTGSIEPSGCSRTAFALLSNPCFRPEFRPFHPTLDIIISIDIISMLSLAIWPVGRLSTTQSPCTTTCTTRRKSTGR